MQIIARVIIAAVLLAPLLARAEPAGLYYNGKFYSDREDTGTRIPSFPLFLIPNSWFSEYIEEHMSVKSFAQLIAKAQKAKTDSFVVLPDLNSYVDASDFDFETMQPTGDSLLLTENTPLKSSYTNVGLLTCRIKDGAKHAPTNQPDLSLLVFFP